MWNLLSVTWVTFSNSSNVYIKIWKSQLFSHYITSVLTFHLPVFSKFHLDEKLEKAPHRASELALLITTWYRARQNESAEHTQDLPHLLSPI